MRYSTFTLTATYLISLGHARPTHQSASDDPVVRDLASNISYRGTSFGGVESFLNIKFGQDTSGNNRFAPPKPFSYTSGSIVDASASGSACPQQKVPVQGFDVFSNVTSISEDCLTLRIDRPLNTTADAKLPVLLWIYGGGDSIGQIYDQAYDPTNLVLGSVEKDMPVLYVAMNYRLGFLGFSAFGASNRTTAPNVGLLDQRLAMQWVQQNIAAFGGDPENVTIFGESDGATSVGLHITAYGGKEPAPFKRAIMESGSATADPGTAGSITWMHTQSLTSKLNCSNTVNNTALSVECLRKIPLNDLLPVVLDFMSTIDPFSGLDVFIPVVDNSFVPSPPSQLLRAGKFAKNISAIIGWNEDDGSLFTPSPPPFADPNYIHSWLSDQYPALNESATRTVLDLYAANSSSFMTKHASYPTLPVDWIRASQITRDVNDVCPALLMSQSIAAHNAPSSNVSTYLYTLNTTLFSSLLAEGNSSFEGVIHFSDIPYVFNQAADYNVSEEQISLASKISGSWVNFAYHGSPVSDSAAGDPESVQTLSNWSTTTTAEGVASDNVAIKVIGGPAARMVNAGSDLHMDNDFEEIGRRCAFWNHPEILEAVGV